MGLLAVKKIIISSRIGRFIDSQIRFLLSTIPYIQSVVTQNKKEYKPDCFVFFLYGGVGDNILTLPLINNLALFSDVVILCDTTVGNLKFLFPGNAKVIIYDKATLLSDCRKFSQLIPGSSPIFVNTSPIIEVYLVRLFLKIPFAIGLLVGFSSVRSSGFYMKPEYLTSHSRLFAFKRIQSQIVDLFFSDKSNNLSDKRNIYQEENNKIKSDGRYVVISTTKSSQWDMGKMSDIEYNSLAMYLSDTYEYNIYFVGQKSEINKISNILKLSPDSKKLFNIAGETNLEELASLLLGAEFVVANDNGVSHMSSFMGIRTLVLFMFSDPSVYLWDNENYAYIFNQEYTCMPCVGFNSYPKDNYPVLCKNSLACNSSISSESIINKIKSLRWI